MQYAKTSLSKAQAPQFREYLEATGFSCRDPKGQYELFQVKVGDQWPAVCFNSAGQVSAPEAVAQYVPLFNAYRKANPKKETLEKAGKTASETISLRDELAILAAEKLMPTAEEISNFPESDDVTKSMQAYANSCYAFADCMLRARAINWAEE